MSDSPVVTTDKKLVQRGIDSNGWSVHRRLTQPGFGLEGEAGVLHLRCADAPQGRLRAVSESDLVLRCLSCFEWFCEYGHFGYDMHTMGVGVFEGEGRSCDFGHGPHISLGVLPKLLPLLRHNKL